jgi:hypothetical protein
MASNNQKKRPEPPFVPPHPSIGLIVQPMANPTEEVLEFRRTLARIGDSVNHALEGHAARMAELRMRIVCYHCYMFISKLIIPSRKSSTQINGQCKPTLSSETSCHAKSHFRSSTYYDSERLRPSLSITRKCPRKS